MKYRLKVEDAEVIVYPFGLYWKWRIDKNWYRGKNADWSPSRIGCMREALTAYRDWSKKWKMKPPGWEPLES